MYYLCFDACKTVTFLSAGRFVSCHATAHPKRKLESAVLLLGYSGECALAQDGREYILRQDSVQVLFPHTLHYGTKPTTQEQSHFWCHFCLPEGYFIIEAEKLEDVAEEGICIIPEFIQLCDCEELFVLFSQMIHEAKKGVMMNTAICDCYLKIILFSLARQCREDANKTSGNKAIIEKTKEWIRLHSGERITVSDVAAAVGYNADYLSQLMKKDSGMTLCRYINAIRLEQAKNLLVNSDLGVAEIAYKVGFSDEKYFMKLFLRNEAVTPSRYRNSCSRIHINNK